MQFLFVSFYIFYMFVTQNFEHFFLDPPYRTRYYQEAQEGMYSGPLFLLVYNLVSLPFSFISVAAASAIIYPLVFLYYTILLAIKIYLFILDYLEVLMNHWNIYILH